MSRAVDDNNPVLLMTLNRLVSFFCVLAIDIIIVIIAIMLYVLWYVHSFNDIHGLAMSLICHDIIAQLRFECLKSAICAVTSILSRTYPGWCLVSMLSALTACWQLSRGTKILLVMFVEYWSLLQHTLRPILRIWRSSVPWKKGSDRMTLAPRFWIFQMRFWVIRIPARTSCRPNQRKCSKSHIRSARLIKRS